MKNEESGYPGKRVPESVSRKTLLRERPVKVLELRLEKSVIAKKTYTQLVPQIGTFNRYA